MKICILTHTFPRFNGDTSAPFMGELAEALVKEGHQVFVLTPFNKEIDTEISRTYKLVTYKYIYPTKFHLLGYSRTLNDDKKLGFLNILLSPFLYFFAFINLVKLAGKEKIDVISAHWVVPNGFVAAAASLITKTPFVATIPGSDVFMGTKNFFFRWMVGVAVKMAKYVVSDSPYYLEQLHSLGFYPLNTEIIRYGVDSKKFEIKSKDKNLLAKLEIKDEKVLLAAGRMVSKKGFQFLINALPEIIAGFPETKLIMVGDGDLKKKLEETAKTLGIDKNVIFTGTVPYNNLQKYYNLADIFIMPSIKDRGGNIDASPVTMMIALISGCQVVATRFAVGQDSINKDIGLMVREKDSQEIAEAVMTLLRRKAVNNLKEKIREIAIRDFSVEKTAQKYIKIFQKILKK